MSKKITIAIIGASFAGLRAYITLKKKFPQATFYLFDKEEYFTYIPSFHISLCDKNYIKKSQFSLKKYFKESFIHEEVLSMTKTRITTKNKTYTFDYAIIATGAKVNYYGNKSLQQHAQGAKSLEHLKTVWNSLPKAKKITIIGAGLSGVEYAAMLAATTDKKITLINSADLVLPGLLQGGREYANKYLLKKGVRVINNAKAISATKNSLTLDSKEVIATDLILMCAGLGQTCPLIKSQEVTNTLHCVDADNIFLCGDVVKSPKVPTAHAAMIEGDIVAQHIIARIKKCQPHPRHIKKQTTLAVALGPYDGFIQFKSFYIPSYLTGLLKKHIEKSILFSYKHRIKLLV